jgi:hypothetical protein
LVELALTPINAAVSSEIGRHAVEEHASLCPLGRGIVRWQADATERSVRIADDVPPDHRIAVIPA